MNTNEYTFVWVSKYKYLYFYILSTWEKRSECGEKMFWNGETLEKKISNRNRRSYAITWSKKSHLILFIIDNSAQNSFIKEIQLLEISITFFIKNITTSM